MKIRSLVLLVGALVATGCRHTAVPLPTFAQPVMAEATAERGEYIVRSVAVCGACHAADPKRDVDGPLSGGMEFRNWRIGTARAANLTPDQSTGLGSWSDAEIVRALRNGQRKNGRLLAPVMPYEWFHEMSDSDALAIARYLRSLPPVRNDVSQNPNLVFKTARLFLGPKPAIAVPTPARAATPEYGAYLARHVGLCGECHTPRTGLMSKPDLSRLFAGMTDPPKGFPANPANLTPDPETGIGSWSEAEFVQTLRTGRNPQGIELHPFMPWKEVRRMSDDDLRAIYRYLRTIPPVRNAVPRKRSGG
ncbi:MAG: c-type cytochrome [Thermoanaerobaculia bacterium]